MKKFFLFLFGLFLILAFHTSYAQQPTNQVPPEKSKSAPFDLAEVAYAYDSWPGTMISIPIPEGYPFTVLGSFTQSAAVHSMCKGGDGNYYLLDESPALYLFDPTSGSCTLIGNITNVRDDILTGISYNPVNETYYMVGYNSFYSLDINTLTAAFIGSFYPLCGPMCDLCFDEYGTCYSYATIDSKAYIIDINTAAVTVLGNLGFTLWEMGGMSYDYESRTIYLSVINDFPLSCQLRIMNKVTGNSTLVYNWGDHGIIAFAINSETHTCPLELSAENPDPPNGATDISVNGIALSWTNGVGTTNLEIWFGSDGDINQVYSGLPITSWDTGELDYSTDYQWYVKCYNDTGCFRISPDWSFLTEPNPNSLVLNIYPQDTTYWTGYIFWDPIGTKSDCQIINEDMKNGWAVFDISSIPPGSVVQAVKFYGYVNATYWPWWCATPMAVNPVTADASLILDEILRGYYQDSAYIYSNENSGFSTGWHSYPMVNSALSDLQAAVDESQGWFAMGFFDRSPQNIYYINFDGWCETNPPYLEVTYLPPIPVEFTSFRADVNNRCVILNWQTATETNNRGFEVQRNSGNGYEIMGFVNGNGTSTQIHDYSFTDKSIDEGNYSYRLRQVDFDGTSEYSNLIDVYVVAPKVYALEQNYPNPFNPSTTIQFSLPEDVKNVRISVYNVLGKKVAELVHGEMLAGRYEYQWNAKNFASGMYIYELRTEKFTSVKKMLLLK